MTQKGKFFARIFKHHMQLALRHMEIEDRDCYTELEEACEDLLEALNPESEPKEQLGPFLAKNNIYGWFIYHHPTKETIGYASQGIEAQNICNWLNERLEKWEPNEQEGKEVQ